MQTDARPRIGVTLPGSGTLARPEVLNALAQRAEHLGFDSVWVADHIALPSNPASAYPYNETGRVPWDEGEPWLSPLLTLSAISAVTTRVELGVSIFVLPLRHPLLAAKDVSTLAALSSGRVILGVGTGWLREEFELLDQPFEARFERTREAIAIMRACWTQEPVSYRGECFEFGEFSMNPKPPSPIPIWGGGRSRRALQLVADICDGWHPSMLLPDEWGQHATTLAQLVNTRDRDPVTLTARPGRAHRLSRDLLDAYAQQGASLVVADLEYRRFESESQALADLEALALELRIL